jgi:uncharacterized membrane protein YfcA
MPYLEIFVPLTFAGGFLRGLTGFGGPLVMVPFFIMFIQPAAAAAIVLFADAFSNIGILRDALRSAGARTVGLTLLGAGLAMPFGAVILVGAETEVVRMMIYAAVGIAAIVLLSGIRFPRPMKSYELSAGGAVAGTVMGATALGILIVPVMFSTPDDARITRANLIVWVFVMNILVIGVLFYEGVIGQRELIYAGILGPVYLAGALLGQRCFGHVNDVLFRKLVLGFLLIFSISGLLFG